MFQTAMIFFESDANYIYKIVLREYDCILYRSVRLPMKKRKGYTRYANKLHMKRICSTIICIR